MNTTKKGHGKTKDKTYIRTFRIDKETASTSPYKHMSSSLSPSIQINGEENALLQPPMPSRSCSESYAPRMPSPASSYHDPTNRNPFHGLPLSAVGESAACSTNDSRDSRGVGPYCYRRCCHYRLALQLRH